MVSMKLSTIRFGREIHGTDDFLYIRINGIPSYFRHASTILALVQDYIHEHGIDYR